MGFFSRKKNNDDIKASEKIIFEQINDNDEEAASLVDKLKEGLPIVINLERLEFQSANKMLAFFSGACYALGGKSFKLNETSYLFVRNDELEDGSIYEFINSL